MEKTANFNPNDPGIDNGNYFGLPCEAHNSALVLLSVPWEVTTSYGVGTAQGPDAIREASLQVDLFDPQHPEAWRQGIATLPTDKAWGMASAALRADAEQVIRHLEEGGSCEDAAVAPLLQKVNRGGARLNEAIYGQSSHWMDAGKKVGLVGGDHSTPLGLIRAVAERHPGVGILHIDAHADLRAAYEGFTYSHASIMYNILKETPGLGALVQVALRDFCDEELAVAAADSRVRQFTDYQLAVEKFQGKNWASLCERIIEQLPRKVYVSFDIDGLSPDLCPSTGTPVPGGLTFQEALYMISRVVDSGREIVGFDLCEVAPGEQGEWDANVGARMLYKLCNLALSR